TQHTLYRLSHLVFFSLSLYFRHLHSFPTRRSSDLVDELHLSLDRTLDDIVTEGTLSAKLSDRLVSHGEKCMSVMMATTIRDMGVPAKYIFTDTGLVTDGRHGSARPNREATRARAAELVRPLIEEGYTVVT